MGHKRPKSTTSILDDVIYMTDSTVSSDPPMYYFNSGGSKTTVFRFDSNTEQEIKRLAKEALLEILQEMD